MDKFVTYYETGEIYETSETLEEAEKKADESASYTQRNITIYKVGETGREEVAIRLWYGVAPSEEDEEGDIIQFGGFGFYDEWVEETGFYGRLDG